MFCLLYVDRELIIIILVCTLHAHIITPLKVIDLKDKTVMYFDSMGGDNHACHSALREWLVAEAKDKKGMVLDLVGWKTATPKVSLAYTNHYITLNTYIHA